MRGTHQPRYRRPALHRFIPACAGNTLIPPPPRVSAAVHLRLCGEHLAAGHTVQLAGGSSPPVRGTLRWRPDGVQRSRFIPACAGNTRARIESGLPETVHPRLCGEHLYKGGVLDRNTGSSPPVRGTLCHASPLVSVCRFIPACAGNTRASSCAALRATVHPRLCGEHGPASGVKLLVHGSSPPVRGTHSLGRLQAIQLRFIPACAGNTHALVSAIVPAPVHPRLCGEHANALLANSPHTGSSPPVRGTLPSFGAVSIDCRFIPACAGNTRCRFASGGHLPVHPRLCGEHAKPYPMNRLTYGSSPPVRGTRRRRGRVVRVLRFIPACAGNTQKRCVVPG